MCRKHESRQSDRIDSKFVSFGIDFGECIFRWRWKPREESHGTSLSNTWLFRSWCAQFAYYFISFENNQVACGMNIPNESKVQPVLNSQTYSHSSKALYRHAYANKRAVLYTRYLIFKLNFTWIEGTVCAMKRRFKGIKYDVQI